LFFIGLFLFGVEEQRRQREQEEARRQREQQDTWFGLGIGAVGVLAAAAAAVAMKSSDSDGDSDSKDYDMNRTMGSDSDDDDRAWRGSARTHQIKPKHELDNRSRQRNPNNNAYYKARGVRGLEPAPLPQHALDNRSRQLNPKDTQYYKSRGVAPPNVTIDVGAMCFESYPCQHYVVVKDAMTQEVILDKGKLGLSTSIL
jgi:hypothetical protein